MEYYKVLDENGLAYHGGSGQWHLPKSGKPGKWMPKLDASKVAACQYGYHLCRSGDLLEWLGPTIYLAEGKGKFIEDPNKVVFQQVRLIRKLTTWTDETARLFACDCAEHVLHLFEEQYPNDSRPREAIKIARLYVEGKVTRDAVRNAAKDIGDATRDIRDAREDFPRDRRGARNVAWAARTAVEATAGNASRDIANARNVAWSARTAVWAATGIAARKAAWARNATWVAVGLAMRKAAWVAWNAEREWQTARLFAYLRDA